MGNKNQKQDEKTLKQMFEEINKKISETTKKREAFVIAADSIKKESFFLECCEEILRKFQEIDYAKYSNEFTFSHDFKFSTPDFMKEELTKDLFSQELQKFLDKYSPEKLEINNIVPYYSGIEWHVTITLV